jgi:hypothetical protein
MSRFQSLARPRHVAVHLHCELGRPISYHGTNRTHTAEFGVGDGRMGLFYGTCPALRYVVLGALFARDLGFGLNQRVSTQRHPCTSDCDQRHPSSF